MFEDFPIYSNGTKPGTLHRDLLASLENDLPSHPIVGDLVFGVFFTNRLAESGLFRSLFVKKTQYAGRRPGQTHFCRLTRRLTPLFVV